MKLFATMVLLVLSGAAFAQGTGSRLAGGECWWREHFPTQYRCWTTKRMRDGPEDLNYKSVADLYADGWRIVGFQVLRPFTEWEKHFIIERQQ